MWSGGGTAGMEWTIAGLIGGGAQGSPTVHTPNFSTNSFFREVAGSIIPDLINQEQQTPPIQVTINGDIVPREGEDVITARNNAQIVNIMGLDNILNPGMFPPASA